VKQGLGKENWKDIHGAMAKDLTTISKKLWQRSGTVVYGDRPTYFRQRSKDFAQKLRKLSNDC
jgi:hypothetical protein